MKNRLLKIFTNANTGKLVRMAVIIAGVYAVLPFLLAARFNQPSADDFYSAIRDGHTPLATVLKDVYLSWSGRYSAILVSRINPLVYHSYLAYKLYPVILIFLFVVSLHILVTQLLRQYLPATAIPAVTSLLVTVYFAVLPSVPEGVYWFSGAYIYQLANVFFMVLFALLVKLGNAEKATAKWLYFLLSAVLGICIVGFNEISLIVTCLCLLFFTVNSYRNGHKNARFFIALTAVCFTAAALAAFAPGNFERLHNPQQFSRSWLWVLKGSIAITGLYITQWAVPLLIATLVYITLFGAAVARNSVEKNNMPKLSFKAVSIFFFASFLFLQVFAVWAAGGSDIGRIENVIYLYFLVGYFFTLQLLLIHLHQTHRGFAWQANSVFATVIILLFAANLLNLNNNISTAYVDLLSGKAKVYNDELDARRDLVQHNTKDTCFVPPVSAIPATLFFTDIKSTGDSVNFWMNDVYSAYLGHGYVITTSPLPPIKTNWETIKDFGRSMRQDVFDDRNKK